MFPFTFGNALEINSRLQNLFINNNKDDKEVIITIRSVLATRKQCLSQLRAEQKNIVLPCFQLCFNYVFSELAGAPVSNR